MRLCLRRAVIEDARILWEWRNEKKVRENSFQQEKIPYSAHEVWLKKLLRDSSRHLYILQKEEQPIGQVRIDVDGRVGIISYSIASVYRGLGYGKKMLQMAEIQCVENDLCSCLKGIVKRQNVASQVIFTDLGYACSYDEVKKFFCYLKTNLRK